MVPLVAMVVALVRMTTARGMWSRDRVYGGRLTCVTRYGVLDGLCCGVRRHLKLRVSRCRRVAQRCIGLIGRNVGLMFVCLWRFLRLRRPLYGAGPDIYVAYRVRRNAFVRRLSSMLINRCVCTMNLSCRLVLVTILFLWRRVPCLVNEPLRLTLILVVRRVARLPVLNCVGEWLAWLNACR